MVFLKKKYEGCKCDSIEKRRGNTYWLSLFSSTVPFGYANQGNRNYTRNREHNLLKLFLENSKFFIANL
jgi:hypothetical protein